MKYSRLIVGNLLVFALILGAMELGARILVPEHTNAYFDDDITRGYRIHLNRHWGHRVTAENVDKRFDDETGAKVRVLFAGDSITFGYGLPFEETYHQVASHALQQESCPIQIEGLGKLHTNLPGLLKSDIGKFVGNGFRPTIFIYQFQPNDVPLYPAPKKGRHELTFRDRLERFRITYLNRSTFLRWIQFTASQIIHRHRREPLTADLAYAADSNPERYRKSWEIFERDLLAIRKEFINQGIEFHIMISPESFDVSHQLIDNDLSRDLSGMKSWPADRIRRIAAKHHIPIFDPIPEIKKFRAENPDTRLFFPNDPIHPNSRGHSLIGDAAANYLRKVSDSCG